jgi:ABC-type Na+ efflux pump permease subunit
MTFLPIVSRELRLASRRRSTYWLRSGAALAIMIVGTWLFLVLRGEPPRELGMALFCVLTGGAVLFALVSGPRSTADCISEEKRSGTLGLLFLTDLKGYDIVLGKLVAGSLNAFYSIIAIVPMLAIPLLMGGGITLAEFSRMALVIIDTLFFSLTVGICVSAMSRSAHKAAAASSLVTIFFAALLPACGALVATMTKLPTVNTLFLAPSVGFAYYLAFDAPYRTSKSWFWVSLGIVHGASWLCLILASVFAPRSWQDRPLVGDSLRWRDRMHAWSYGTGIDRTVFRRRLLDRNPVYWLLARIRSKPAAVWLFLGVSACIWVLGWWRFRREWLNEGVYLCTAIVINLVLRYWFAGEAARAIAENRKLGALELLLSTPLKIEDILRGQWLALKRQFLGALVAVLLVECLFMLAVVREAVPDEERLFWFALWIAGMLMLVADLATLYWVGMWQGLTARNPVRAAGGSLVRVLVVPWIGYGLVLLVVVLSEMGQRSYQSNPTWKFFLGLWFGIGIGLDFAFGAWARQKLLTEFRLAAQQQYDTRSDFWRSWFGSLKPHVSGVPPPRLDPEVRA